MKKTHWLRNTLIVLVACGLIGTILAVILFNGENNRTYAASTIQFSFDGSDEGKAPNGYSYDLNGITTDEVLNAALEASGLADTYTADQLRSNLTVTGVFPEKIAEQMSKYVSLLDADADTQAALTDYHATQYSVVLYNDFDKGIASGKLTELLENILAAYRTYFAKTCTPRLDKTNPIAELPEYDYAQQMDAIGESVNQQMRYAQELDELAPEFRTDKKGFGDIVVRYQNLKSDIDRLNATITLNAVSKDRDRLKKRYEMEIRTQNYQLGSLTEELKLVEEQMSGYEKDGIVYVSSNGELNKIGSDSGTYDQLVRKRKEITDQIAEINATISLYQKRLDDMLGVTERSSVLSDGEDATAVEAMTAAERKLLQEDIEKKIAALIEKKNGITAEFTAMMEGYTAQEINEKTVSATEAKYNTPKILSGAFIVKMIKTAGPFCAVGFMVCMVLLIISRRKEEKAEK